MKRVLQLTMALLVTSLLAACGQNRAAANSDFDKPSAPGAMKAIESKMTIPDGTRFRVALIDGVSTAKSSPGDEFLASLVDPVVIDGKTVFDKGTKVRGRVTDVNESGRVKGRASIRLVLTTVALKGKDVTIATRPFVAVAENTKKRDAAMIGGGTGVGALIGGIAGGGKGAAIGAAVGAGAGTGTVLATKGKEIHYPPETKLSFTLAKAVTI